MTLHDVSYLFELLVVCILRCIGVISTIARSINYSNAFINKS